MTGPADRIPTNWKSSKLQELLREPLINGRSVKTREGGFPVLRLTAIRSSTADLSESKDGDWNEDQAKPFLATDGDFLVSRGNGSIDLVGRGAEVPQSSYRAAFPDTMIRIRVRPDEILTEYLARVWESSIVREQIEESARTTSGIYKINQRALGEIRVPVPPLDDQRRIAKVLASVDALCARRRKAISLLRDLAESTFLEMFGDTLKNGRKWRLAPIAEAGDVQLGRQRAPKYQTGKFTRPYIRVANVYEDRIDLSDLLSMDFDESDFKRFRLNYGDILLNEGQSTEFVGRPAMWREEIEDCCFQNTLIRFRSNPEIVDPQYALASFLHLFRAREFAKISSKTSSVAHLGAARFGKIPIPIPPIDLQRDFSARMEAYSRERVEV